MMNIMVFSWEIGPEMGDFYSLNDDQDYTWRILYFGGAKKSA